MSSEKSMKMYSQVRVLKVSERNAYIYESGFLVPSLLARFECVAVEQMERAVR